VAERIEVQNRLADKFLDYLRGFKTFKSMGLESLYLRELGRDLSVFTDNARRSYGAQLALAQMGEPLFAAVGAAFLLVAYYWFQVGMETIIIFFALLTRTYSRLSSLQVNLGRLVGHTPAIRACVEFDALARAAAEPESGRPLPGPIASVELERMGFVYPDGTRVFEDVSLRLGVERGLIVLAGPSGAGKSTLLDLFAGLLRPSEGVFRINGVDVRDLDLHALRARVGVVPQSPILFNRSVRENISLRAAEETEAARVEAAARLADAHEFVSRLARGYDTMMGEDGAALSVGQTQRISIARALYQDPDILFCDEPTSALDAVSAGEVMRALDRIAERYPVFLISHDPRVAERARQTIRLEDGRIHLEVSTGSAR
jgi:ABC-type multidrug transport system fused ATPase/permease subunit